MLDLQLFRDSGAPEDVRESQRRRGADATLVDAVIAADALWREQSKAAADAKHDLAKAKSACRPQPGLEAELHVRPSKAELTALATSVAVTTEAQRNAQAALQELVIRVGNLVHEDVPSAHLSQAPSESLAILPHSSSQHQAELLHAAALRRLFAAGLAEPVPSGSPGRWRPSQAALLLQQEWCAYALEMLASRGYTQLTAPLPTTSDRRDKFERLCRERGESSRAFPLGSTENALGALHACSIIRPEELPLRYVLVDQGARENAQGAVDWSEDGVCDDGCEDGVPSLWLHVACADDGSCWGALNELMQLAEELHAALHGMPTRTHEMRAEELGLADAKAFTLNAALPRPEAHAVDQPARGIELARVSCEFDYRARRLGMRCGFKTMGERNKRHPHTLRACLLRPSAALLALGATQPDNGDICAAK